MELGSAKEGKIMAQANQIWKTEILHSWQENVTAGCDVQRFLEETELAKSEGGCIKTLLLPKVFRGEDIKVFRELTNTTYEILKKVIVHYKADPAYRRLFPFSKEMEQWICMDTGYASVIPMMRLDIFYNEATKQFCFCEINTDGTSAMVEDQMLRRAFRQCGRLKTKLRLEGFELFDKWVETVGRIYADFPRKAENPHIAIVDFLENGYLPEFWEFQKHFQKYGYSVEICDIRALSYRDGSLFAPSGKKIDMIYRRAVTCDIEQHQKEIQPFLQAAAEQAVCMIGGIQTQVAHHKALFYVLRQAETKRFLSEAENAFVEAHIPYTARIQDMSLEEMQQDQDRWIIKPIDSYAAKGVFAGVDFSAEQWKLLTAEAKNKDYIVQKYCTPFCTWNVDCTRPEPKAGQYKNMTGLYVYDGQFAGIYSRMSDSGIIATNRNERAVPTYIVLS